MARKRKYEDLPERSHPDYMRLYSEKNKEAAQKRGKLWRSEQLEKNPDYYKERYKKYEPTIKKWREENKDTVSEKQWKSRGIIDLTYDKFLLDLEKQNGNCLICEKHMTKPQADHDHETGQYRGLLCIPCNNGLGVYELHKEKFENYLKKVVKL